MKEKANWLAWRGDTVGAGAGGDHRPALWRWTGRRVMLLLLGAGLLVGCGQPVMAADLPKASEGAVAASQEPMTVLRLKQIINLPGDAVPLVPQLATIPLWTNAVVTNVMTYATGKVVHEGLRQTAKTVGGKYVVFTVQSQFYHQLMSSLLAYDDQTATLKLYGLYSDEQGRDVMVVGMVTYDYVKKSYTMTAAYGDGFQETMSGVYSDSECVEKSVVKQHDVLFMTRETKTRPAVGTQPSSL